MSQGLMKEMTEQIKADVMVVNEQNRNEREENAWYSVSTGRVAVAMTDGASTDNPGQPKKGFRWVKLSGICLYSCYLLPHSSLSIIEFTDFIDRLETSINGSTILVIAAGNFNAKSGVWNSGKEDARSFLLTDLMASLNLPRRHSRRHH